MQQLNMEGGQFHSQFHQTTLNFIDQRIKVGKPTQIGENMKFKEFEAKNKICAINHKHTTRESRNCSPTSRICSKTEGEWNPRCRKPQTPWTTSTEAPLRVQETRSSQKRVTRVRLHSQSKREREKRETRANKLKKLSPYLREREIRDPSDNRA